MTASNDFLPALVVAAPPPKDVWPVPAEAWERFVSDNGFAPPPDFRLLTETYGPGGFGYYDTTGPWLVMLHPVGSGTTLVEQSAWLRSHNKGFQRQFPEQEPDWPMWPEPGGFLPWATSIDGDQIGWLTDGEPETWGTGFYGRGGDYHRFPFGCAELLYRLFTGCLGVEDRDAGAERDLTEGSLRFFPGPPPDPSSLPDRSIEVTLVLTGVGGGADGRPLPSTGAIFEPGKTMEERLAAKDEYKAALDGDQAEAMAIVDGWMAKLPDSGIRLMSGGRHRYGPDEPLHWEFVLVLPPEQEEVAKGLAVDLAAALRVAIKECRTPAHDPTWPDVVARSSLP